MRVSAVAAEHTPDQGAAPHGGVAANQAKSAEPGEGSAESGRDVAATTKVVAPADSSAEDPKTEAVPLQLRRLVVTQAIEDREPAPADTIVLDDQPVFAFVELVNDASDAQDIVVTFERKDGSEKVGFIELKVPGKSQRWRTWGNTRRIQEQGAWIAVVHDKAGRELGRTDFAVQGG
jgi:hypothetical protein